MYRPPDFTRVFRDGEIFQYPPPYEKTLRIKLIPLGELMVPTGKIVAFDPSYTRYEAFDRSVAAGRYPVWLAMAQFENNHNHVRVAGAKIQFQEAEAIRWEIALLPNSSEADDFYCYGVDAGLGCFADELAASALMKRTDGSDDYISFINALDQQTVVPQMQCANMILDQDTRLNICIFNSGYGDGCYPSYWGIGADGTIVSLATDFILGDIDEEE